MQTDDPTLETRPSESPERERDEPPQEPILHVDNLVKEYSSGDETITAVDGVSFDIEPGTIVGLLGPNGAGKTTLIKMILGIITPSRGEITFNPGGEGPDLHRYRSASALLEGSRNVYWKLTARENLDFFAGLQGIDPNDVADYHQELLERFGIAHRADEPVETFSRGMKQRAALASVLAKQTPVVFLDEPTLGLDVEAARQLRHELPKIATEDRTIILSSHNMNVVRDVCDRVIILNEGQVVADDAVEELISVFNTRTFRLTVSPALSATDRDQLESLGAISEWEEGPKSTTFGIDLVDREQLFGVVEELKRANVVIEDIKTDQPELEDVFIYYTQSDDEFGQIEEGGR